MESIKLISLLLALSAFSLGIIRTHGAPLDVLAQNDDASIVAIVDTEPLTLLDLEAANGGTMESASGDNLQRSPRGLLFSLGGLGSKFGGLGGGLGGLGGLGGKFGGLGGLGHGLGGGFGGLGNKFGGGFGGLGSLFGKKFF